MDPDQDSGAQKHTDPTQSGFGSATLIFKIPKYNEHSFKKKQKNLQSFAFNFCVNMKVWRTWGGRLFTATSSDEMDKRWPL
jgi:hypothetical protein